MTLEEALSAYTVACINRRDDEISAAQAALLTAIHDTFATKTVTVTTTTTTPQPAV